MLLKGKKKKNDFFSDLEKGQNEMLDLLKNQQDENEEEIYEIKELFTSSFEFIESLIEKINKLKKDLLPFKDKNFINSLKAIEVHKQEKEMKKLWKMYYEESITRNVLKKNKIKKELNSSSKYESLVQEELKDFKTFQEEVDQTISDFFKDKKESQI